MLLTSGVMEGLLFGVTPNDPLTITIVVAGLLGTALLAAIVPAHRTSRIDPMITMRAE